METRTAVNSTVRDVDAPRREVLLEFPHDVRDSYDTTFGPDAFRASLARRLPIMCWQHDLKEPIGRITSAQVTHRANEMVGKLSNFDDVPLARRAFHQIQDGTLTDVSFGFTREADEPHPEMRGVTRITRATMREVSPVSLGSIPGAGVTGTRTDDERARLEELFERHLGSLPMSNRVDHMAAVQAWWRGEPFPPAWTDDPRELEEIYYRSYGTRRRLSDLQTAAIFEKWEA